MKYFQIKFATFYELGRIASEANGENIPAMEYYFNNMRDGQIITNVPLLDYFFLESYDEKKYWEWKLCDVHRFTRTASLIGGWLISEKLKLLLNDFNISTPYHFYSSKLLYKGEKLDYYIFQFAGKFIYKRTNTYIDYNKTEFFNPSTNTMETFKNIDDYALKSDKLYFEKNTDYIKKRIVLKEKLDFFPMQSFYKDNLVSERLKQAIETKGITGFEFSELDYEVVVEK
jgi:hypothetical protein